MSKYEAMAAKRFREYKWRQRKVALDKKLISLAFAALHLVVPALERTGLTQKRIVEEVKVE